jgi:hypothetical protein
MTHRRTKDEAAQQEKVLTKLKESDAEGADIRNAVSRGASEEKLHFNTRSWSGDRRGAISSSEVGWGVLTGRDKA